MRVSPVKACSRRKMACQSHSSWKQSAWSTCATHVRQHKAQGLGMRQYVGQAARSYRAIFLKNL